MITTKLNFILFITILYCLSGCSGESGEEASKYAENQLCTPPTNIKAIPGNNMVTISWDDVIGASSYNLYYSNSAGVDKLSGEKIENIKSPYIFLPILNGVKFYYVITALNENGESAESKEVSSTLPTALLDAPADGSKGQDITFDASGSYDEEGSIVSYYIDYGDGSPVENQISPKFSHIFNDYGVFTVTLTVIDSDDGSSKCEKEFECGFSMSEPVNISNSIDVFSDGPLVSVDQTGGINIIWEERGADLLFSNSQNDNYSFRNPLILHSPQYLHALNSYSLLTKDNEIHAAWAMDGNHSVEIYYTHSVDGGNSFQPPIFISLNEGITNVVPHIASNGQNYIGIAWQDTGFYTGAGYMLYSYSTNNGQTFSNPIIIGDLTGIPSVAIDKNNDNIYVAWSHDGNYSTVSKNGIYFTKSTDRGVTFSSPVILYQSTTRTFAPKVQVDSQSNLLIAWDDCIAWDPPNIVIAKSEDHGETFNFTTISSEIHKTQAVQTYFDDNNDIYLLLLKGGAYNPKKAYMMYSNDQGVTFSKPILLSKINGYISGINFDRLSANKFVFTWGYAFSDNVLTDNVKPEIFSSIVEF